LHAIAPGCIFTQMRRSSPWIERNHLLARLRTMAPGVAADARAYRLRVSARAFRVSVHQLVRWHKAGLLPRPRRRSLGRGRGMESLYPRLALPQTLAIALMRQVFRNLESVRWCLWCMGFPVTESVRQALRRELAEQESRLRKGYERFRRGVRNNPIARLAEGGVPAGFGRARRRVGRAKFETLGRMFHEVLLGEFGREAGYDGADYELVLRAIAPFGETRTASSAKAGTKLHDVEGALSLLSREFNLSALRKTLEAASVGVLCRIRDEAQTLYRNLGLFEGIERSFVPKEFFLLWFAVRHASPTLRQEIERAATMDTAWMTPEPTMLARVGQQQAKARRRSNKPGSSRPRVRA